MKKIAFALVFVLVSSCGILKDVKKNRAKEKIRLVESSIETETAPGDNVTVYLPYPVSSPERPKRQIKTYTGEKGATVKVEFDSIGSVNRIDADCPEVDKMRQHNLDLDYGLKTKEVERKANVEIVNAVGKWSAIILIPIGFFFALAFYLKS